jgi:hypothetical protein
MTSLSPEIETLHILLEHFYDSQRNENRLSSPTSSGASQSREARICSVRSGSSSGGVGVGGSVAHREGSGRPPVESRW